MTRARWLTGALIGAAALIVSGEALATYLAQRLVVGIVAVVVLMAVLAIGFASLARARRYVAREISALGAEPPSGALYESRRAQLSALHRRGVSPDLELLADATAAAEAERGYTGKYLVATTVLIGLVGTFGGLMETLGRVAPLLKGDLPSGSGGHLGIPGGAFALIAGPLAGLHVTFGTSVVAILVTLALALIQGDVTLHHERLLALLQERTRHVLVPELWPAEDSAAERTVRALLDLRAFVEASLATSAAKSAEKIAGVVRVEVQRLVAQIGAETQAAAAAQTAALERTGAALTDGFRRTTDGAAQALRDAATTSRETTEVAAQALRDAATASRDTMNAAATTSREAVATAASAAREAAALAAAGAREAFSAAATAAREQVATALEALASATARASESIARATATSLETFASTTGRASESIASATAAALETFASTTGRASDSIATSTAAAVTSLEDLRGRLSAQLDGASGALATAAAELRGTVGELAPALGELAPQLGALTAEVALLAARADSPELPNAVLDELVRLAEDVERLVGSSPPTLAKIPTPDLATMEVAPSEVATEAES